MNPHMVTTALELEGYRITRNLGLVRGIIVRSRSILGTIGAACRRSSAATSRYLPISASKLESSPSI